MLKKLFRPGATFPANRQEGMAYTEELADGIRLWIKIDVVGMLLAIIFWAIDVIPAILLGFVALFSVGCPIIMVLGFSIGCLQYLKPKECYEIIRTRVIL